MVALMVGADGQLTTYMLMLPEVVNAMGPFF